MRSYASRCGHKDPKHTLALCWQANKPGVDNIVAEIHLAEDQMYFDLIVHECAHAAYHRTRLQGVVGEDFEEYACNSAGLLADVVLAWLRKHRIKIKLNCVRSWEVFTRDESA